MESVDMASANLTPEPASQRVSKRLRKRPTYFMPGGTSETATEDDVKYRAVVTDHKGFKDFMEDVNFKGTSSWRLSQILRRLSRGLKVDPRMHYIWTIWSEDKQSTIHAEWEKLTSMMQLKNQESWKLRCYKQRKAPPPAKKPEPREAPKDTPRSPAQSQLMRQPQAPSSQLMTPDMRAMAMSQFPFFSQQDYMMMTYMMMCTNPWLYMQPYQ